MNAAELSRAVPRTLWSWQMSRPAENGEPGVMELKEQAIPELKPGEALIEIAGCGVCGSDIGYFSRGVKTLVRPPITLGHEISGTVLAGPPEWRGREVIVPTILPCGSCELCAIGRANRCLRQKMPGNSLGSFGGFASHIVVPSRDLCPVPEHGALSLAKLAVVADAVSTPYQAARRAELRPGDKVMIIGATGGCGFFLSQWAKHFGARVVIALGRSDEKLERCKAHGSDLSINVSGKSNWHIQKEFWHLCRKHGIEAKSGWKIFEVSGTKEGQELALELLGFAGLLTVVGYSTEAVTYQLSRLSPFDAEIRGTWGCLPAHYPTILDAVLRGDIELAAYVREEPMSRILEVFRDFSDPARPEQRVVLVPDFAPAGAGREEERSA